jgi:Zn-dependent metalloprotease
MPARIFLPNHRHSVSCFFPEHMLLSIIRRGNSAQRDAALNTFALDSTQRARRATTLQFLASALHQVLTASAAQVQRVIYTAGNRETNPWQLVRSEGQPPVGDQAVNEAYDGLGHTFDFYLQNYQRNSVDDNGLPLSALVHYGQNYCNAFWDGGQMLFGDGDSTL